MAVPPPDSSYTPPETPINESPFTNDSMEDLDPQATRKRPRLDSGSGVSPTLSLDGTSRTASVAPASDMDEASDSGRPASKVTINMKSPEPSTSIAEKPEIPDPQLQFQLQADTDATRNVISLSSSPSTPRSPEIQVAEPEDMDQDPASSNWRPLEHVMLHDNDADVIEIPDVPRFGDAFPKVDEDLSHRENFKALGDMIEHGHQRDTVAILAFQRWLNDCVRDLNRLTYEEFTSDLDFWEYLPSLIERLMRRQVEVHLGGTENIWTFFEELFLDYSRIVLHLVRLDVAILRYKTGEAGVEPPFSTSRRYLHTFHWIFNSPNVPFYVALHSRYSEETLDLISRLRDRVTSPAHHNALGELLQYASSVVALLPNCPPVFANLPTIMSNVCALCDRGLEQSHVDENGAVVHLEGHHVSLLSFYETTRAVDKAYQTLVAKKSQVVTSDMAASLMTAIFRLYQYFCNADPDLMLRLAAEMDMTMPDDTDTDQTRMCVIWTWKFDALKKQIIEGRMELRVNGVEAMQSDLVHIWANHINNQPNPPFVQYLVKLLRGNGLLEYLVGVDSHPQLIGRTSNIFGFLIVAGNYDNYITDLIWKVVTDSQDDRTVSGVVAMLARTFPMHTLQSDALLYVCSKLLELPLERFDTLIIEMCQQLVPRLQERFYARDYRLMLNESHVDTVPLQLCVRLIRESAGADLPTEKKEVMQEFGSQQLVQFIKAGLGESEKTEIYESCIQDIAEMNARTGGSIQVLNALVSCDSSRELWKLANDFDLTRLVITELRHFVDQVSSDPNDISSQHGFASRVHILQRIIDLAPETITPELGNTLWKDILMSDKLAHEERQIIWKMAQDTTLTTKANPFIERCIHEYLPEVPPKYFSHELLAFAKQSVFYEIRSKVPPNVDEDEVIFVPGMDRIWNLILTAPPQTIEADAIKFAIDLYLDHVIISRSPKSAIDATHVALVGRCVDQLKSAAAALKVSCNGAADRKDTMEVDNQNSELGTEELTFSRSLLFLRQLLHGLRTRPRYTSPRRSSGSPPDFSNRPLKGDAVIVRYQCFGGPPQNGVSTMTIGDLSTASELADMLVQLSRFSKYTLIFGGQKLDLFQTPDTLIKDLNLGSALLIVRKAPDAQIITSTGPSRSMTAVDREVLKHFDELYELLDLKNELAEQIIDFLVVFPPQGQALELVRSNHSSEKELFPLQTPFKALYSLNTLSMCLHEVTLATDVIAEQEFVFHSIQVLVAFLALEELSQSLASDSITTMLASKALECLLLAISVYHPTDADVVVIPQPASLVPRVLSLLELGCNSPINSQARTCAKSLICNSFAVLVEGSLRDSNVWAVVKQHVKFEELIFSLLLEERERLVRREVLERLKIISGHLKPQKVATDLANEEPTTAENPLRIDMLANIWSSISQLIPKAPGHADQSEEFFTAALWIFRSVAERSPRDLIFNEYMKQWTTVLLDHNTEEFVGREPADNVVIGLCSLLEWCLELATTANVTLESLHIAEQLMNKYLFPDFLPDSAGFAEPRVPMMHSYTRQRLYHLVNLLCKQSDETYSRVLELLENAVPRDTSYLESSFDRSGMIRSPEGYAGLRNLSNTCYLNSLMTQLFMNIEFRDFILNLHIADPASQKLLYETQKLFTWMQETWRKSIEPQDFVESIKTYDNEQIDVTVQMDVDEFYNLLFDRWEAQILDTEKKKSFRSFFGGQLVQQIKSMECDHISEREEPFSAIQCEIKGKATLEESLRAYVAGEVMQGNNKYSCTSCGRHVDAVKRACLKEVPDSLIFHLKRFDFDMMTMLRSKINDEFQFPEQIDMAPYTLDHLSDPNQPIEPDMFELVGVLVHTGTAESGHYYSYTVERPSSSGEASWVEFNDSEVSRFDPAFLSSHCYGGFEPPQYVNGSPKIRVWNAYMLFYQRVSTIERSKSIYKPSKPDLPVHIPVPADVQHHIAMDNEVLIRTYCLLDPQYAMFVDKLLQRWSHVAAGENKLRTQAMAVNVGMDTMEQLISRTKDLQGYEEIYRILLDMISTSSIAARSALQWVSDRRTAMRNILTKTPMPEVRAKQISLIHRALRHIHGLSTNLETEADDRYAWRIELETVLHQIVPLLIDLWPSIQCIPRVWEDYFAFFVKMCGYGPAAVEVLLEGGAFIICLHVLWIDNDDQKGLQIQYANFVRLLEKGRRFSYFGLLSLCLNLLKHIDLSLEPTPAGQKRGFSIETNKFAPRETELDFITPLDSDGSLLLLIKILKHYGVGRTQTARGIVAVLLDGEPQAGLLSAIQKALESGLRIDPASECAAFLEAAVTFCQHCPDQSRVVELINFITNGIETIDSSGGHEHMNFFTQLCGIANERLDLDSRAFTELALENLPIYAPTLLIDRQESVRMSMQDILLNEVLARGSNEATSQLSTQEIDDDEPKESDDSAHKLTPEQRIALGRRIQRACAERLTAAFLKEQIRPIDGRQLESIMSVINFCLGAFYGETEEDEHEIKKTRDLLQVLQSMSLQEIADSPASESDIASGEEWDATSVIVSDSEPGARGSP